MGFAAQLIFWPKSLCEGLAAKGFRVVRFDNRDIGKSTHLTGRRRRTSRALEEVASGKSRKFPIRCRHGRRRCRPHGRARRRPRPCRRRLDGRHDRPARGDQPSGADEKPDLDHVHHRPTGLAPGHPEAFACFRAAEELEPRRPHREQHSCPACARQSGFPASEAEIRANAERRMDRAPYDPAGIVRHWAAIIAAPPRNELLRPCVAPRWSFMATAIRSFP